MDSRGNEVHGDHLLLLNARARAERGVVTTIMSNMALELKLQDAGVTLKRTAVGDRYVHEGLHQDGLHLGGEQSGHLLFLDVSPTGDGVLTALLSLAAMRRLNTTLDALHDDLVMFPQTLVNVRVKDKAAAVNAPEVQAAVRAAKVRLNGRGRINLRPSGTENLVRVMVEGPDAPRSTRSRARSRASSAEERAARHPCEDRRMTFRPARTHLTVRGPQ